MVGSPSRHIGDWIYIAIFGGVGILMIAFVASQYFGPNLGTDKFALLYSTKIGPLQAVAGVSMIGFAVMKYRSTRTR